MRRALFTRANYGYRLLATGQATVYVAGDNGTNQNGVKKAYTLLNAGQFSGTVSIAINSKTDTHSNNVALDNNTGLMWSNHAAASVGPTSNGLLPWTTTGSGGTSEGIFPYLTAANVALLSGYADWRIPNIFELMSLADFEAATSAPDATAFPSWSTASPFWSSTTQTSGTTLAMEVTYANGIISAALKTTTALLALVRG